MSLFHPRQAEIDSLQDQIRYLREQLALQVRINTTLASQAAARFLYPSATPTPPPIPYSAETGSVLEKRNTEAPKPEHSLADLQKLMSPHPLD